MIRKAFLLSLLAGSILYLNAQNWKIASAPLQTPWAEKVNPNNVLPEYPRPIMERPKWQNLNGLWQFQQATLGDMVPFNKSLKGTILVPYPWESALSGVRKQFDTYRAWYRRTFTVPSDWKSQNIMLNFGAVDWESTIYINGRCVGIHKGGYDPFSFNITKFLSDKGPQEIIVGVYDPGDNEAIAIGKQANDRFLSPKGYSYCPASGIWQTVWIEPVPKIHIKDIKIVPDIDEKQIQVTVTPSELNKKLFVEITAKDNSNVAGTNKGTLDQPILVNIQNVKLWSPQSPFLYDVVITIKDSTDNIIDEIKSYAGMRKISLGMENGHPKLFLNNKFMFQFGPLDQGFWPDGIYTAPTDEALRWDIEQIKDFGYNMVRKHIKVEPQRWYYWADKLGLLVWQDMPSTFKQRNEEEKTQFEWELSQMVRTHWNHPCIIQWIVFNEHWGIYDVERLTPFIMGLDPSRLVTGNSGIDARKPSIDFEIGHIKDNHSYRPPSCPLISSKRATVNGEFGAIGYKIEGHIWDIDGPWVHYNYADKEAATLEYEKFIKQLLEYRKKGLSGAIYTQLTDVENEMNGLYTYDRKVEKLDKARVKAANLSTYSMDLEK